MEMLQNIKYIDDDEQKGIKYDWDLIFKMYKSLKCPDDIYDPTTAPMTWSGMRYIIEMSIRSTGKTTGWVLIGMIMNALYGTVIPYVRQTEEETAPKYARELMNVIVGYDNGRYIKEITGGRYNTVVYKDRRLFYSLRDEAGKEIDRAEKEFLILLAVDLWQVYKSTLNVFRGDLIIFDEFVGKYYKEDAYINFMQLISTVKRRRQSTMIVMLANTIRYTSQWYREFMVQQELKRMELGDKRKITTAKGTKVYIEMVEPKAKARIAEDAALYYGFDNPDLLAIVGTDAAWSFPLSPRIKYEEDDKVLTKRIRLKGEEELKLVLVYNEEVGLHVNCYPATGKLKEDEVVLTLDAPKTRNEIYALGRGEVFKKIWELYKMNLFYFSDNETAVILEDYVQRAKEGLRKRI